MVVDFKVKQALISLDYHRGQVKRFARVNGRAKWAQPHLLQFAKNAVARAERALERARLQAQR